MKAIQSTLIALSAIVVASFGVACGDASDIEGFDVNTTAANQLISEAERDFIASLSDAAKSGTVEFVNASTTTVELIDITCGLHSDTSMHLIGKHDRRNTYASIEDIANSKQMGIANLSRLVDCARDQGFWQESRKPLEWEIYHHVDGTASCLINEVFYVGEPNAEIVWTFQIFDFTRSYTDQLDEDGYLTTYFCAPYDLDYFAGQYTYTASYVD
jgi:hypothetical protein